MTTRQVAAVLDRALNQHESTQRRNTVSLIQFEVTISENGEKRLTKATWGPEKEEIDPIPAISWTDLWTDLKRCGRAGWPQLIRLPEWMVEAAGSYSREQLARLFKQSNTSFSGNREDRKAPFVTLEPDDDGNYLVARADADGPGGTVADVADEGTGDHKTVVFLDGSEIVP